MTLLHLTNKLQDLCYEGYSNEEVMAEIGDLGTHITTVRRSSQTVRKNNGTHEENIIVLRGEK